MAIAVLLLTAIPAPAGATSNETIPYIDIEYPTDGSTVGTQETLVVVAEGYGLQNPSFSVSGENVGFAGPLTTCYFTTPMGEEIPVEEGIGGYGPGPIRMYCKQPLNLQSFEGENIKVSVSVYEQTGRLTDSVGLYVSGHCA